ncbi:MAG TPA: acetoin utilization protein AcuC [Verrucomicrobiae bacterium]|nr:acetoin utilization protein AcuC [Verrucomicrobiae bacterium]
MKRRTALIHSPGFTRCSYGDSHPMRTERYRLAFELMEELGLLELPGGKVVTCDGGTLTEGDLLTFHSGEYLRCMAEFDSSSTPRADFRYGLGDLDNPVFPGFYTWARLCAAATLEAGRLVTEEGFAAAFNPAGGWHHAQPGRASGFSYLNDAVILILRLLQQGLRVAYVDLDAHHGDGVQDAFYDDPRVLTVSLHQSGVCFFPGTGLQEETGRGEGRGYCVNLPLREHTDDVLYMKAFDEAALPVIAAFDPDILVTQAGPDTFRTDPLSRLDVTTHAYSYVLRKLRAFDLPWVVLGGGGYAPVNVARAWSLAWGIMNDRELPELLPPRFVASVSGLGYTDRRLLDPAYRSPDGDRLEALLAVESSISAVRRDVFPVILGRHGRAAR